MTSDCPNTCIFCLNCPGKPYNAFVDCTYGSPHEYPAVEKPKQVVVKVDRKLCIKCGLHPKNPKAVGCEHEFAS